MSFVANVAPGTNQWISARLIRHQIEAVRQAAEVVAAVAETGLSPRDLTRYTLRPTVATTTARERPVVSARLPDEVHLAATGGAAPGVMRRRPS